MNETSNTAEKEAKSPRGTRKQIVGKVVSDVQAKTITVEVTRRVPHPKYKKVVKSRKRYAVHDEAKEAKAGDMVRISETRPISKTKRWRLVEIISRAE